MEKEQIIKALECCTSGGPCRECEYKDKSKDTFGCRKKCLKDALALIKQQDEQIFQLENRLKECENGYAGTLHLESCKLHDAEERLKELTEERKDFEIRALRAENQAAVYKDRWETSRKDFERLAEDNERLTKANEVYAELEQGCLVTGVKKVQANTVREFAERLKKALNDVARWSMHGDDKEYFIIGKAFIDRIADEILNNTEEEKK